MQLVRKFSDSPHLRPAILQAVLEDTYIDEGGVGSNSPGDLSTLQQEIKKNPQQRGILY